ncbi:hypothetical protein [Streptomyces sp. NPDC017940]|uniref:hypothetical protein n=1 Tax=Streptomyces sp. NPDC017940 TaxID=3365017 RepID=UPI0037AC971D
MLANIIATAVLLAELGVVVRYRFVRRGQERPGHWPQLTDARSGHLAVALAAALTGWAVTGADTDGVTVVIVLFLGVVIPVEAAVAATVLWRPLAGWLVCAAGGLTAGAGSSL